MQKLNARCVVFHKGEMESVLEADFDTIMDHVRETLEMVEFDDYIINISKCEHLRPITASEDELKEKEDAKD